MRNGPAGVAKDRPSFKTLTFSLHLSYGSTLPNLVTVGRRTGSWEHNILVLPLSAFLCANTLGLAHRKGMMRCPHSDYCYDLVLLE